MRLEIDEEGLGRLFPASISVDAKQRLTSVGPALRRHCPAILIGDQLSDHFSWIGVGKWDALANHASRGTSIQLRHASDTLMLSGTVVENGDGYFLALNIVPTAFAITDMSFRSSDFGPSDPIVQGLMLVCLQQAMIEEARANATELARERRRSFELMERVSRVSGYMAHDFNNHLSIIRLNGDRLLRDTGLSVQQRRLVEIMLETAARGSAVSSSLMALAHQHSDSRVPLNVDALLQDHFTFFTVVADIKVSLRFELDAARAIIMAPRMVLLNCLINLLINARDAMPDGGEIVIATQIKDVAFAGEGATACDGSRPYLAIRITDTGLGMGETVLSRAFEPFFSTKTHGSGVGLASILEFVREMGGDVCLDSQVGEGTTVYIYLPVDHFATDDADLHSAAGMKAGHGSSVMVVEDEPYALEALVEMLETNGYAVSAAASAAQAIAMLEAKPHQLVLTDVIMPETSGLELAEWISQRCPQTSVILMSGFVPPKEKLRPEWNYVRKPLDIGYLSDLLAAVLKARPAARDASIPLSPPDDGAFNRP